MFDACVKAGFAPRIVQPVVEISAVLNLVPALLARLCQDAVAVCRLGLELHAGGVSEGVYLRCLNLTRRCANSGRAGWGRFISFSGAEWVIVGLPHHDAPWRLF